jgi:hypothetical protein
VFSGSLFRIGIISHNIKGFRLLHYPREVHDAELDVRSAELVLHISLAGALSRSILRGALSDRTTTWKGIFFSTWKRIVSPDQILKLVIVYGQFMAMLK